MYLYKIQNVQIIRRFRIAAMHVTLPRYLAVSLLGFMIGTFLLWFFVDIVGLFYLVAGGLGALISVLIDFIFHQTWTFSNLGRERKFTKLAKRFGKFITSKALGFFIGMGVLAFLTQIIGFHYLISNLFAVGASFACNYTMSSQWVWSKRDTKK